MDIIELSNYSLQSRGLGNGLDTCFFSAARGDVWKIESDNINDAHLLINGLATLSYPSGGTYTFDGQILNFSDYRKLLPVKKRIGYIASDTTLISNRTVRENLTLKRIYFDNDLSPELTNEECRVCDLFQIDDILDVRPDKLKAPDIKKTILVRELLKKPDVILIEYPDEFAGYHAMDKLINVLNDAVSSGLTLIYSSHDPDFELAFPHHTITIKNGILSKTQDNNYDSEL